MKIRQIYKTYNVTKSNANEKRNQSAQPAKAKAKAKAIVSERDRKSMVNLISRMVVLRSDRGIPFHLE